MTVYLPDIYDELVCVTTHDAYVDQVLTELDTYIKTFHLTTVKYMFLTPGDDHFVNFRHLTHLLLSVHCPALKVTSFQIGRTSVR